MIHEDKAIVIDLDGTLSEPKKEGQAYKDLKPNKKVLKKLREYKKKGFYIIIQSARNMLTANNRRFEYVLPRFGQSLGQRGKAHIRGERGRILAGHVPQSRR